jgi:hypothetical protein
MALHKNNSREDFPRPPPSSCPPTDTLNKIAGSFFYCNPAISNSKTRGFPSSPHDEYGFIVMCYDKIILIINMSRKLSLLDS